MKPTLFRLTTVPLSLDKLLEGQMRFMSTYFDVIAISSDKEYLERIGKKEDIKVYSLEMTRQITLFKDLVAVARLYLFIKKGKPLIIHTHTPKAGLLGMFAAWMARVPIRLHTVAGLPLMEAVGFKRKVLNFTEWLTYYCATKVYPNSKNLQEFIITSKFCKPSKLKVIGNGSSNGINTNYFKSNSLTVTEANKLKAGFALTEANFVFLFIGRLVKDKGIEELVEAFLIINNQYPHTRLLLVGPFEPERDPLSNKCLSEIDNNTFILTSGYQKDVRPYLLISQALVFPSYREGFPNVPMQAGCFNLPCIVTDINGCNEIIEQGVNGLIVPVKDSVALHNAMRRLITDEVLYAQLKDNSRRLIVERYDQAHFWSLLLNEYREQLTNYEIVR
jgi:glycosyltransferase involved in cell wall biosynthesis